MGFQADDGAALERWEHEVKPEWDFTGTVDEAWSRHGITIYRCGEEYLFLTTEGESGGPYPSWEEAAQAAHVG